MSFRVKEIIITGAASGIDNPAEIHIICDTLADLPSGLDFVSGYVAQIGSTAHIVSDSTDYEMQSSGAWVQQTPAGLANVYTREQTDAMLAEVHSEIDENTDLIIPLIDTGAKNKLATNSGSNTLPTRWLQIPVNLPPGTYTLYIGDLQSTDTDASTCQFVCFDSSNNAASNYVYMERGTEKSATLTISAQTSYFRLYPSDSYAHSDADTVTADNIMICTAADFEASPAYAPYCPTLAELYALVKSYHP